MWRRIRNVARALILSGGPPRRPLASAAALAALALAASGMGASAHNWGAGTTKESYRCLAVGDTSPAEWRSECTTDDEYWYVYVSSTTGVPSAFRTAIYDSIGQDYFPVNQFFAYGQTTVNSNTDVYVIGAQIPHSDPYGIYTTCENHQNQGGGTGYYRWCEHQEILVDPNHPWTQQIQSWEWPWLACHELGHTTGLQHPANLYGPRVTCMDYDEDTDSLDAHDKQHLTDCYPRPSPPPYDLTTACREYQ